MKKLLIAVLTVLMLFSFAMFTACNAPKEEQSKESIFIINGFNEYDDIARIYLNPNTFFGSFTRNKDANYIVEGKGSYKFWVKSVGVSQPNFNMKSERIKTDITDVLEFGLYIYSELEQEFSVILTCQDATQGVIYSNTQTIVQGANNIVFPVNRVLLQDTGTAVAYYDIAFSGLKGGTNLYLDNFYAKVTTEEVEVKQEVQTVINEIVNLKASDRTAAEATYAKYKALSPEDRLAVYNYKILRTIMLQFWNADISNAKDLSPNTLAFFDKPYGEGQVKAVSVGVESFGYTESLRYGNEEGSLKLTFKNSSLTWNNMTTTINTPLPEDTMVEFYVYNASEQKKGFKVDWTYPSSGFITLQPYEWTKIFCEASNLTARGYMVFTGLTETLSAAAPEGAIYFSSIKAFNAKTQIAEERKGDDANTLLFYDRELGLNQISDVYNVSSSDITLDTSVKMTGESASVKINVDTTNATNKFVQFGQDSFGYNFKQGDVVVMYVYADVTVDYVVFRFSGNAPAYATRVNAKTWTMVVIGGEEYKSMTTCKVDPGTYTGQTVELDGAIYLSKAKVLSKDDVKQINEEGVEYTLGNTTFIKSIEGDQLGSWAGGNGDLYSMHSGNANATIHSDVKAYALGGVLRFYRTGNAGGNATGNPYITLTMKEGVTLTKGTTISIKMRGLKQSTHASSDLSMHLFGQNVSNVLGFIGENEKTDAEDGYVIYTFTIPDSMVGRELHSFRIYCATGGGYSKPYYEVLSISDVTVDKK